MWPFDELKDRREKARFALDEKILSEQSRWIYRGTAVGTTRIDGDKYDCKRYWVLSERDDGKRRYELIKTNKMHSRSEYDAGIEAKVKAWVVGGPVPPLEELPPRKSKPNGDLVMFEGGKKD